MGRQEGRPLQQGLRRHYEAVFGHSLGTVRIHTGPLARSISTSLRADGVTDGRNIALRRPELATADTASPSVLAHELVHVHQQQRRPGSMLFRVPWTVDEGRYYTDRGGAVVRGRKLQQDYMSVEVFQRDDGNWQVRYRHAVPQPTRYPAVDSGLYYTDRAGADRRANHLRAHGFVVEVFQRSDDNWQCRLLRLQGARPALPTSTGPDSGFYYTARASAERRVEALGAAGFTATVVERDDGNFQADISSLPSFRDSGGPSQQGPQVGGTVGSNDGPADQQADAAQGDAAQGDAAQSDAAQGNAARGDAAQGEAAQGEAAQGEAAQGEAAQGEAAQGEAAQGEALQGDAAQGEAAQGEALQGDAAQGEAAQGDAAGEEELNVEQRVANFVTDLNASLATLRTARLEELRAAAPNEAAREAVALPTITVTIAPKENRTAQDQARNLIKGKSWTCRSAHLGNNAQHVLLRIDGTVTWQPKTDIESHFGSAFYTDFVEAWDQAMADNDLRNFKGKPGWAPGDAYHLEMPDRNVPQKMVDDCIAEYVRLTREEGEKQVEKIEKIYKEEIEALLKPAP